MGHGWVYLEGEEVVTLRDSLNRHHSNIVIVSGQGRVCRTAGGNRVG